MAQGKVKFPDRWETPLLLEDVSMKVMLDAMRAKLAEEKHSGMLVAHKGDFELHDRSEIQEFATPMSEYLWFVRPTGTWLAR